jgi:outer membrane protein assembly factor BamB
MDICPDDPGAHLYCFDAKTGRRRWKTALEKSTNSTPVVTDGYVYVASKHRAEAYRTDGRRVWQLDLDFGDRIQTIDPAVTADRLVLCSSGGGLCVIESES